MMRRSRSFSSLQKEDEIQSEEDEGDGSSVINAYETESYSILKWPSTNKNRKPMVNFAAVCVLVGTPVESLDIIRKFHLGYKFMKTECRLVRNILTAHGFKETGPNSLQFNLMWTGTHLKPYTLRALTEFQKVNHFPRSYELTRKDRLYKNIQRMQHSKGTRHFDFVPQSYVLTAELNDFYAAFLKDKGPWIVKPVASSRGRGIYLIGHPNEIPVNENVLVCKYIDNPLLVNGFKFDCRLYVAVTCYDPLRLYLYEEGLARFSTVKYEKSSYNLSNMWMHLTNYSVNKNSEDYVRCEDPEVDDYGSKWSFSAMLRCLKEAGKDVEALMARIEDVIIKTIISGEMAIATACKMFVPHRGNCFELFGFDILIDDNLKPWLLEVNLSPSLACDSPLDLKIKANLITDLFNLTGFVADDPTQKKPPKLITEGKKKQRHSSAVYNSTDLKSLAMKSINKINDGLTNEERRILRETKEEIKRCGGFVRIYPSPESWELYSSLQEHQTTHNRMLHSKLYPELWRASQRPQSATYIARARNFSSINKPILSQASEGSFNFSRENYRHRYLQYIKKLDSWSDIRHHAAIDQGQFVSVAPVYHPTTKPTLAQGQLLKPAIYEENLLLKDGYNAGHVEIVKNGQYLSKFQARAAFAVYLRRVQQRLLDETSTPQQYELSAIEEAKQEQQIGLIHKFLVKAAVNLSNPFEVIVPKKSFPLQQRKKNLAHQLIDFVRVYTKETEVMMERDGVFTCTDQANSIDEKTFNKFIKHASECELEDILTLFTKHNKSASIFLGAKAEKKKVDTNNETLDTQPDSVIHYSTTQGISIECCNAEKQPGCIVVNDSFSRPLSGYSQQSYDSRSQSRCLRLQTKSNPLENGNQSRLLSAGSLNSNSSEKHCRPSSSKPRLRSHSAERVNNIAAVCAYTGTNSSLKQHFPPEQVGASRRASSSKLRPSSSSSSIYSTHVFGVDDPELTKALKRLSIKRAERNYASNKISSTNSQSELLNNKANGSTNPRTLDNTNTSGKRRAKSKNEQETGNDSDTLEKFIKYGQQFVVENKKTLQVDRNNFLQQSASTQTTEPFISGGCTSVKEKTSNTRNKYSKHLNRSTKTSSSNDDNNKLMLDEGLINFSEPRPPDKRPVIKKQINSQRMNRLVGRR